MWKCCKFLAVRQVSVMTLREWRVDHPFPYHVIRCWVRTSPLPTVWALSRLFKPCFLRLNPQTPKRCHMDLWLAHLVLTHLHRHRHHPSLLQQLPEFRESDFSFCHWCFFSCGLFFALFLSSKELSFSSPFSIKYVMRVAHLFSPLAPRLAALTTVSLEW